MRNERGFTLVELLITVFIVSVLACLVFVNMKEQRDSYSARATARKIYSNMQMARLAAIKQGRVTRIDFNGLTGTYSVDLPGTDRDFEIDLKDDFPNLIIHTATDPQFNANGTASGRIIFSIGESIKKVYVSSSGTGNIRIVNCSNVTCPDS